jgi:DNA primase
MASGVIEQIKEKLDIVNEIGAVVALKRAGKDYKGLCPFHNERTPSFYIFPDSKTWRCFGCNEGGDIFTFIQRHQGLDFRDTLALLAEKAGVALGGDDGPREPPAQTQAKARLRALNDAAAVWFHHQLLTAHAAQYARSYLQSRGITNETIAQFRLGFAPEGDHLTRYLIEQGYSEDEIIEAGFARRREGERGGLYDYFRNRVIFPIRDGRGQTIGFGGRELGGGTPKYLNTPQTLLFDKSATLYGMDLAREAIRKQDEVVIVEGYVDAIMAHQYGYHNTVACIGSAITIKHVQSINKLTHRLVLALDPDPAGEAATLHAIQNAQEGFDRELVPVPLPADERAPRGKGKRKNELPAGMVRFEEQVKAEIRVLQLPDGVDPDEFIRADPPAWGAALKQALPLIDFYFDRLLIGLDLKAPADQIEAKNRIFTVLAAVADRAKQEAYIRQLAALLRIDERSTLADFRRYRRQHMAQHSPGARVAETDEIVEKYQIQEAPILHKLTQGSILEERASAGRTLENHCIGLLLNEPEAITEACGILTASDFWGTETRTLFTMLAALPLPRTRATVDAALAMQPEILQSAAQHLRTSGAPQPALDRTQLARTAKQIAYRLRRLRLSDAITEISYLQREADEREDREAARSLREQALRLTLERHRLDATHMVQT